MKKVFLDTNVVLDFVTQRDGYEDACDIFQLGEDNIVSLCVSFLTMANTAYIIVTNNTKHFKFSKIQVLTPKEFLNVCKSI